MPDVYRTTDELARALRNAGWGEAEYRGCMCFRDRSKAAYITLFAGGTVAMGIADENGTVIAEGKCQVEDVRIIDGQIYVGASSRLLQRSKR